VVGDVAKSGGYLIESNERLTAIQVLALAGGANRTAAENKARLIRKTPENRVNFPVPLRQILAGKMVDPLVEDGDILFVPSSKAKTAVTRSTEAAIALTTGLVISGRL
jgi:polysaccharide export outer membrane protein